MDYILYTVERGDTPQSVAEKFGLDTQVVIAANGFKFDLYEGQILLLPAVKTGEYAAVEYDQNGQPYFVVETVHSAFPEPFEPNYYTDLFATETYGSPGNLQDTLLDSLIPLLKYTHTSEELGTTDEQALKALFEDALSSGNLTLEELADFGMGTADWVLKLPFDRMPLIDISGRNFRMLEPDERSVYGSTGFVEKDGVYWLLDYDGNPVGIIPPELAGKTGLDDVFIFKQDELVDVYPNILLSLPRGQFFLSDKASAEELLELTSRLRNVQQYDQIRQSLRNWPDQYERKLLDGLRTAIDRIPNTVFGISTREIRNHSNQYFNEAMERYEELLRFKIHATELEAQIRLEREKEKNEQSALLLELVLSTMFAWGDWAVAAANFSQHRSLLSLAADLSPIPGLGRVGKAVGGKLREAGTNLVSRLGRIGKSLNIRIPNVSLPTRPQISITPDGGLVVRRQFLFSSTGNPPGNLGGAPAKSPSGRPMIPAALDHSISGQQMDDVVSKPSFVYFQKKKGKEGFIYVKWLSKDQYLVVGINLKGIYFHADIVPEKTWRGRITRFEWEELYDRIIGGTIPTPPDFPK